MSADRQEKKIEEPVEEMRQGQEAMEHRLDELGEDIDDAKKTAGERQDAPDPSNTIGDWRGEATGSGQGEDAEDTASDDDEDED